MASRENDRYSAKEHKVDDVAGRLGRDNVGVWSDKATESGNDHTQGRSFAERSVAATGSSRNHLRISVNDSSVASDQAIVVEEGSILSRETSFLAEQDQAAAFGEGQNGLDSAAPLEAGTFGSAPGTAAKSALRGSVVQASVSAEIDFTTDASQGTTSAPPNAPHRSAASPSSRPYSSRGGVAGLGAYSAADKLRNKERAEAVSDADGDGLRDEGASAAFQADEDAFSGGAIAFETAGDVFETDKVFDYSTEVATVVDRDMDWESAGQIGTRLEGGKLFGRARSYGKAQAKAAVLGVIGAASGDLDDDSADSQILEKGPQKAKDAKSLAKRAYSKMHGANQQGYSAAAQSARNARNARDALTAAQKQEAARGVVGRAAVRAKEGFAALGRSIASAVSLKTAALVLAAFVLLAALMLIMSMCAAMDDEAGTAYVEWAMSIAEDDRHGYAQEYWSGSASQKGSASSPGFGGARDGWPHRAECYGADGKTGWSDFDCSSLVYYSLLENGWTVEELGSTPFTTYTMPEIMSGAGFTQLEFKPLMQLEKGDVLISDGHTEIFCGDGKLVGAHSNSHGGINGDEVGDQTGKELSVGNYYDGGWVYVMRCNRQGADFAGNDNIEKAWNFFTSRGYSEAAAAGIIGNLMGEGGPTLDPTTIQGGGAGPAFGIAQWENYNTRSGRFATLCDMAAGWGYSYDSLEAQLLFIDWEMNGGDPRTKELLDSRYGGLSAFKSSNDVVWTTTAFLNSFERPGIPRLEERIMNASAVYAKYAG